MGLFGVSETLSFEVPQFVRTLRVNPQSQPERDITLNTEPYPEGPCAQTVYTLAPKHLCGEYFKGKVYTICVHGPLGVVSHSLKSKPDAVHRSPQRSCRQFRQVENAEGTGWKLYGLKFRAKDFKDLGL